MRKFIAGVALASVLIASVGVSTAATPPTSPEASPGPVSAQDYCVSKGGIVQERDPVWGTNLPNDQWIQLGEARLFCEFVHGPGSDDNSGIQIDLESFVSDSPRLATVAYLAQVPWPTDMSANGSNPATHYCAYLGGTQLWGGSISAAGGGWVTQNPATEFAVMDGCTFADGSIISAWGLAYHAKGTIRGADLTKLLAYQPGSLPRLFQT